MKTKVITTFAMLTAVVSSWSAVTIDIGNVGIMRDNLGTMVTSGSVGLIVADTDGNGLVNAYNTTLTAGLYLAGGTSDLILGVYQATDLSGSSENGFDFSSLTFSYSGSFGQGDNLWLVWFPTVTVVDSIVGSGVSYGTFRTALPDTNLALSDSIGWVAPTDGSISQIVSVSASLGGNPAPSDSSLTASLTTAVPEPATWALLAGSLTTVMVLRRRRSKF